MMFMILLSWCGSQNILDNLPNNTGVAMSKSIMNSVYIKSNELYVYDIDIMKKFYIDSVWFEVISESGDKVNLWNKKWETLLTLIERKDYPKRNINNAWLYHIAYVHKDRSDLASRILRIFQTSPDVFQWSADHNVSEAFYFVDPELNGIELYYDKDPNGWIWNQSGYVTMWSAYIDPNTYIQQNLWTWSENWYVWHNHLQVGNLVEARKFYYDILWFEITQDASNNGALFVSSNHYHHHFGLNVRNSNGAWARPDQQLWLWKIYINIWDTNEFDAFKKRLESNNHFFEFVDNIITISDPWNNKLVFTNNK